MQHSFLIQNKYKNEAIVDTLIYNDNVRGPSPAEKYLKKVSPFPNGLNNEILLKSKGTFIEEEIFWKISTNKITTCICLSVCLSANRRFYALLSCPADYILTTEMYWGCLLGGLYWNPSTGLLQKVQKTVIFRTKSYGRQLRLHAYHNNNSAPGNDRITRHGTHCGLRSYALVQLAVQALLAWVPHGPFFGAFVIQIIGKNKASHKLQQMNKKTINK